PGFREGIAADHAAGTALRGQLPVEPGGERIARLVRDRRCALAVAAHGQRGAGDVAVAGDDADEAVGLGQRGADVALVELVAGHRGGQLAGRAAGADTGVRAVAAGTRVDGVVLHRGVTVGQALGEGGADVPV